MQAARSMAVPNLSQMPNNIIQTCACPVVENELHLFVAVRKLHLSKSELTLQSESPNSQWALPGSNSEVGLRNALI